ncbi:MAG: transglutaminase-like cysteine peptidase [Tardiphaga sp.]
MTIQTGCLTIAVLLGSIAPFVGPSRGETGLPQPSLAPIGHTQFCQHYPSDCEAVAAKPELPRDPAARLAALRSVHDKVNGGIAPRTDTDPVDRNWLIWPRAGDCDDYAVTKRHVLLEKGWPSSDLLLAEVVLLATGEHHLLLVVRDGADAWVLDNRKKDLVRVPELYDEYTWVRIEAADNPQFWKGAPGDLARD